MVTTDTNTDTNTQNTVSSTDASVSITASGGGGSTNYDLSVADPTLSITSTNLLSPFGWILVNADGTTASAVGTTTTPTATRTAVGRYTMSPPLGATLVQLAVVEPIATTDSIEIHPTDFIGSSIHISEGDNGTGANVYRDRAFTAVWYGASTNVVTGVTIA